MPLRKRHSIQDTLVFFITTSTYKHKRFPDYLDSFETIKEILFRTAKDREIIVMAYVLMPNHIHVILGSNSGGARISKFIHSLKGRIRETLQGKGKFWQEGYDDVILFSQEQFNTKINYIHYNPVRAGLVKNPEEWIYSSYCNWFDNKSDDNIKTNFDWII